MRTLFTSLFLCLATVAQATDMTVSWQHDGSGAIDEATGQLLSPLERFNVYQSSTETGQYRLTHTLDDSLRQQTIEMSFEPTTWVKMTAVAGNGVESYPSAPVSKTLAPPPPPPTNNLTVRALDANRVEITGKTGACRSLKTTGTGLKRIVTCVP